MKSLPLITFICCFSANAAVLDEQYSLQDEVLNKQQIILQYLAGKPERVVKPSNHDRVLRVDAHPRAGYGYSCGEFDAYNNIQATLNNIKNKAEKVPGELAEAGQAAVTALPLYLLQRADPGLLALVQDHLDQAFNLFQISYKSCKKIEQELHSGNNNPYGDFARVSIAEQWTSLASSNIGFGRKTIQQIDEEADEESLKEGFTFALCKKRGGRKKKAVPGKIYEELIIAGFNTLHRREIDDLTPIQSNQSFTMYWDDPSKAVDWTHITFGEEIISFKNASIQDQVAGQGLKPAYDAIKKQMFEALKNVVNDSPTDYIDLQKKYRSLNLKPEELKKSLGLAADNNALNVKPAQIVTMINNIASSNAHLEINKRVYAMRRLINAGLASKCIAGDAVETAARSVITRLYFRVQAEQNALNENLEIQRRAGERLAKQLKEFINEGLGE